MNEPPANEPHRNEARDAQPIRRSSFSNLASVIALAVSIFALAIGAWQTRLMQTQARAGVWPYVVEGFTYNSNQDENGYIWHVENNGVGPARIESVVVSVDGKPMKRWKDVIAALGITGESINYSTSSINGDVIPPSLNRETAIDAIRINDRNAAARFRHATDRFAMDICYCSVYDDCWLAHWQKAKVDSVPACRNEGVQFEE